MSQSTCGGGPRLIFACSGASDVGEIADRAARKLSREGVGKMYCISCQELSYTERLVDHRSAQSIPFVET